MAITSYAGLLEALQKWTARSDSTFSNRVDDFIALAEDRILNGADLQGGPLYSPALKTVFLETTSILAIVAGIAPLPAGYLGARKITRPSDPIGIDYLPLERFEVFAAANPAGSPAYYTIEDGFLRVAPSYTGNLSVTYYAAPTRLAIDAPTNTLLTAHPMVYLTACLFEAFSWMQEPDLAMGHLSRLRAMIDGLNKTQTMRQFSGVNLRVQPRRPIP
jgi:hypothetical protein